MLKWNHINILNWNNLKILLYLLQISVGDKFPSLYIFLHPCTLNDLHDGNPCTQSAISLFFLINWNMKLEIKFWYSFLYWSWDRNHQNKYFSDFQNKFKFEVCFSFFILILKTRNQFYLNKYLMKLVAIPLTQS